MTTTIVRVVKAPNPWHCSNCGGRIRPGEQCAKMGSDVYCKGCVQKGM